MKQYNCKNCGAPVEHSYNHKCPYCHSLLDFNEPIENTIECKPEDLVNIELREIQRIPGKDLIILIFSGYKCVMPKIFEYDGKSKYISSVIEYRNPPKCGFCIELSRMEIEKYGLSYILHCIHSSGVRLSEFEKLRKEIYKEFKNILWWCN